MHFVHLITGHEFGAQQQQALRLAQALNDRESHNTLICEPGSVVAIAAQAQGLEVILAPDQARSAPGRIMQVRRVIRELDPALVHIHRGDSSSMPGAISAWLAGVPAVLSTDFPARRNPVLRKFSYGLFERILTRSTRLAESLIERGLPAQKHCLVRTGVDAEDCRPAWTLDKFQREFDLNDSNIAIGMIAELEDGQGHRDLFKALPGIYAAYSRTRIILIGEGRLENQFRKIVESQGLESVVSFAGRRPDLSSFLGHFDMLIHLSPDTQHAIHLIEAQAAGVPVVAFDQGAVRESVADGHVGNLVANRDPVELTAAIKRLMYRPEKRKKLGKQAQAWVREEFAVTAMVESYIAAYRNVLQPRTDRDTRSCEAS